jgi:NAD dependent epimerase/dehydratase family enzyme
MNGVAPNPVHNTEFTKALGRALHRPAFFPAPAFGLRLAIGEFADVLLASQRVKPGVALRTGYEFKFPEIDGALADVV